MEESAEHQPHAPWNKSVIVGKSQRSGSKRLDSKLWAYDLVKMRMHDICQGDDGWPHATVMQ